MEGGHADMPSAQLRAYTLTQVARRLQLRSGELVFTAVLDGDLRIIRVDGKPRVAAEELARFKKNRRLSQQPPTIPPKRL